MKVKKVTTKVTRCDKCKGTGVVETRYSHCAECGSMIEGRPFKAGGLKYCSVECMLGDQVECQSCREPMERGCTPEDQKPVASICSECNLLELNHPYAACGHPTIEGVPICSIVEAE